jgi:vitamin B12 transporter
MNPLFRARVFGTSTPLLTSLFIPLVFSSAPLWAENTVNTENAEDKTTTPDNLDQVIVTATRTARTVDETLASVTIITREDIQKQQASSLQELLQAKAGLSIVNNGGAGKVTSLFMRGTNSDHVLVLIDGIKINTATDGAAPLSMLPLEMVERIEVVRGPRTSLYGSDAIGGVIQIFTKRSRSGEPAKPTITVKAGSHNTKGISAGISGSGEKGWYSVNLKRETTDGYNACTGSSTAFAGCFTEELDKDGYENTSASLNVGYQITDNTSIAAHYLRSDNSVEFDGAPPFAPNEEEALSQTYGLKITTDLSDRADIMFSAGHNTYKDSYTNSVDTAFFSRFDTSRNTFSLQSNIDLAEDHLLTLGLDYLNDKVDTTSYNIPSRNNKGVFAEYQGKIAHHSVNFGLRNDDNEQFGNKLTGNIGISHPVNDAIDLTASYGTAFKAPSFNELYFPFYGSSDLKPEESGTVEIGLRGRHSWGNWSSSIYRTRTDNLIVYDASLFRANNIAKAEIKGFEAMINTQLNGWDLSADLTLLDTENKTTGGNHGNKLARRPDRSLRLNIDKDFGKFTMGSSIIGESSRFDNASNTLKIGGYGTVDLRASYQITKNLSLQAKVGNVFDKHYETAAYYPQDGRNYMLTLSYGLGSLSKN